MKSTRTGDPPASLEGSTAGCRVAEHSLTDAELAADVRTLAAVGTDTRYETLRLIAEADGDVCVCELEPALGVSQGAISQGLSKLHAAGLVTRRKDGRWRYYATTAQARRLLDALDDGRRSDDA